MSEYLCFQFDYRSRTRDEIHSGSNSRHLETTRVEELPGWRRQSETHERGTKHHSKHKTSNSKEDIKPVFYNFEDHRPKLCKIFFRNEDLVQYGTQEYHDFWKFVQKMF